MIQIALRDESITKANLFVDLAQSLNLHHDDSAPLILVMTEERLELRERAASKQKGIYVNFASAALIYRRRFGGGRHEAIARAAGVKTTYLPSIIDATAGLGRDAFVLAALGCHVVMVERHPIVKALLFDGLQRGYQDINIGSWLRERLILSRVADITALTLTDNFTQSDVIYLDPMYPASNKRALVKKEMRLLQLLAGKDSDSDNLLAAACQLAKKRVVVKRPNYADPLANLVADAAIISGSHRFDIYTSLCNTARKIS